MTESEARAKRWSHRWMYWIWTMEVALLCWNTQVRPIVDGYLAAKSDGISILSDSAMALSVAGCPTDQTPIWSF